MDKRIIKTKKVIYSSLNKILLKKEQLICGLSLQKNDSLLKSQYCQKQIDIIARLLMEKFEIKKDQSILYSNFIVTTIWTCLRNWMINNKDIPLEELKEFIFQFIHNGCGSLKRNKI